jgi:hypothetical protein
LGFRISYSTPDKSINERNSRLEGKSYFRDQDFGGEACPCRGYILTWVTGQGSANLARFSLQVSQAEKSNLQKRGDSSKYNVKVKKHNKEHHV